MQSPDLSTTLGYPFLRCVMKLPCQIKKVFWSSYCNDYFNKIQADDFCKSGFLIINGIKTPANKLNVLGGLKAEIVARLT